MKSEGVQMEQCCEYVHAQNGALAEWEIGILATLCQSNMEQAGAPKWLWGECMHDCAIQHYLKVKEGPQLSCHQEQQSCLSQ